MLQTSAVVKRKAVAVPSIDNRNMVIACVLQCFYCLNNISSQFIL